MVLKRTLWIVSLSLGIVLAAQPFISFEENENWSKRFSISSDLSHAVVQEHAYEGKNSMKVEIPGSKKDTWPGFSIYLSEKDIGDFPTLQFNAWHEEQANVSLSVRIDFKGRNSIFTGVTIAPRSKVPAVLFLNQMDPNGKRVYPFRAFIYRRMPRNNVTLWFDNFRFANNPPSGNPIDYLPPAGYRQPTAHERSIGAQFFRRNWMTHVFPNVRPLPSDSLDVVVSVNACPGETEPATLSFFALKSIQSSSLSVPAPLVGPGGAVIPPSAFTVYHIRCLDKRTTYQAKAYYRQIPMVLDRAKVFPVPADTAHSFWLDIAVPEGTPAGVYKGSVRVTLDDAVQEIPVSVTVRPFSLPSVAKQYFGEYYTSPNGFPKEQLPKIIDEDFAFMRSLGMTSIGLCFSPDTQFCKYADGKVTIELKDDSLFVVAMNTYVKYGYPCPVILLDDPGFLFAQRNGGEDNEEVLKAVHCAFWIAMQEECKKRGWPELIIQPVDEPGWQSKDAQDRHVKMLKLLKNVPGLRTEQDGPGDDYFFNVAGPYSDVWTFNGSLAAPDVMEKVYKDGKTVLFYNCDVESYRPVIGRYSAGFFQYLSKCHGLLNWAYRSFRGSPFDDFDYVRGDTTNYYPSFADIVGGPGIGLVSTREGIDDYRYVSLLQDLIASRPGLAADEARKVLDDIFNSITYSPALRNCASFTIASTDSDGNARVTGDFNLPNGWRLADYDLAREIIAGQIMRLLGVDANATAVRTPVLSAIPASKDMAKAADADEGTACSVVIPTCSVVPVIDGVLDDACWKNAGKIGDFQLISGGKPEKQTTAWFTTDGVNLYIAVECDEPLMEHIIANVKANQGPVYSDDCVEIFLDPAHKGKDYMQICVNSLGYNFVTSSKGNWKPQLKTAGHCDKDKWSVEVAIPLKSLGQRANSIGLNVCRERRPLEVFELSCWSPTGNGFATPSRFGSATFGHAWLSHVSLDNLMLGNGSITVDVINPALDDAQITIVGEYTLNQGKECVLQESFTKNVTPQNETATFTQPVRLSMPGQFHLMLTAKNAAGDVLEKLTMNKAILPAITTEMSSPFVDHTWNAIVSVNYNPMPGEKINLAIWPESVPKSRIDLQSSDCRKYVLTLSNGNFLPRDRLILQLTNQKSEVLGDSGQRVLTK
ncbi:MAG: hypothetical protein J6X55_15065 [Victivallales bacterium]|nr:hypothetical protein [Victivallales bacterium]